MANCGIFLFYSFAQLFTLLVLYLFGLFWWFFSPAVCEAVVGEEWKVCQFCFVYIFTSFFLVPFLRFRFSWWFFSPAVCEAVVGEEWKVGEKPAAFLCAHERCIGQEDAWNLKHLIVDLRKKLVVVVTANLLVMLNMILTHIWGWQAHQWPEQLRPWWAQSSPHWGTPPLVFPT